MCLSSSVASKHSSQAWSDSKAKYNHHVLQQFHNQVVEEPVDAWKMQTYRLGHLAKDFRIEKKVEETTNLTLEAEANEGFLLMAQNEINSNDNVWYLDSGASNHMCGYKNLFKEMRKIEDGNVSFGDASKVKVEGKGTIRYLQKDGLIGSIQDVYYVPNLKTNILSLGQLTEKGYSILMKERILHLKDKLGHLIARVEMERNRMYKLNLINVREKCLQWDWNSSTEVIVEVEESSVAVPPNISTKLEDSDNEDEPPQPIMRSLQDLYDSTSEVHL
ncbi:hypothetical protein KIW84_061205 [Lathyrus oleraceus]|uniref:Retrovirus-related Pol polyprotein from transposon TNT 1-94-like beta-barrel domain-containing protein n=1 Tax=Pisum sativum TaxID=3888 RepID=A0A9D4W1S8_PEA|nr:hypothetical protein KIW84_061205 [Pisum sativum]